MIGGDLFEIPRHPSLGMLSQGERHPTKERHPSEGTSPREGWGWDLSNYAVSQRGPSLRWDDGTL